MNTIFTILLYRISLHVESPAAKLIIMTATALMIFAHITIFAYIAYMLMTQRDNKCTHSLIDMQYIVAGTVNCIDIMTALITLISRLLFGERIESQSICVRIFTTSYPTTLTIILSSCITIGICVYTLTQICHYGLNYILTICIMTYMTINILMIYCCDINSQETIILTDDVNIQCSNNLYRDIDSP